MTTPMANLELALTYLIRTKELAQLFGYSRELQDKIDLLRRATIKTKAEMASRKAGQ